MIRKETNQTNLKTQQILKLTYLKRQTKQILKLTCQITQSNKQNTQLHFLSNLVQKRTQVHIR